TENETPETYLGYARAERFDNVAPQQHDVTAIYNPVQPLPLDHWTLKGSWRMENEKTVAVDNNAALQLHFNARKVFLVMGTTDNKPVKISIGINGASAGKDSGKDVHDNALTVTRHAIYEIVDQGTAKEGQLEITAQQPGLEVYAFTFGG